MKLVRLGCILCLGVATRVSAQRVQPEVRVDVIGPVPASVQPGVGINVQLGTYSRLAAAVGAGARQHAPGDTRTEWRGDLLARVTLDPFRQQRWALGLGGGVSIRRTAYLAVIAELEGPAIGGWIPVFQAGVSGGARGGVIIRRAVTGRR